MTLATLLRSSPALALAASLLLLAGAPARAQTLLDDYSSDLGFNYTRKTNLSAGWTVAGGTLQPQTVNNYAALVWTDIALEEIGDSFSLDIDVNPSTFEHNGGLAVWKSNTVNTSPAVDRVFEPRFSWAPGQGYSLVSEVGHTSISGDATGWATLTVTLSGRSETDTFLTAVLSGSGFAAVTHDYTVAGWVGDLYLGPSAFNAGAGNVQFDNLTHTSASAIPEPSTYAALFGATALGFAAWRRRRASAPSVSGR